MSLDGIRALTVDTGGTVLDWHGGFRDALARAGQRHGIDRDWATLANALRRRSLEAMLNLGQNGPPEYNFDQAHRFCLDALLADEGLDTFDEADRHAIAWEAPHGFAAWPDVKDGLAALRSRLPVVSFTLLSYRLVIDSGRQNGLTWDAILSCEGLGVYKLLPEAYRRAAGMLQLAPEQCLMVACHPFDLDAARDVGFRTALVRRPLEWGPEPPEMPPPGGYDIEVDDFIALAQALEG
ncbi:HAD family hydrolase [Lutimaribacter marinistellae]|uniref:HAD family hydrolase n=1 Tax=Lutimaribacter marinistellae TaxID=1820329 RepID=A0ABV7TDK1_9RHOB